MWLLVNGNGFCPKKDRQNIDNDGSLPQSLCIYDVKYLTLLVCFWNYFNWLRINIYTYFAIVYLFPFFSPALSKLILPVRFELLFENCKQTEWQIHYIVPSNSVFYSLVFIYTFFVYTFTMLAFFLFYQFACRDELITALNCV